MNNVDIASLPITVTEVRRDGYVGLMIGDKPAVIWRPNSAILYREGLVILRSPAGSEIEWESLISVQSRFGNIYNGFTDDNRLVSIAYMVDRGCLDIPLGLLEKPLEVRLLKAIENDSNFDPIF
ncbi:MAG: hypothetical protein LBB05_00175 [Puniceicoccales bacterium]|jgi:hypothetical protein|nr:hypothetical protein [Puniceicoccales bacterium]